MMRLGKISVLGLLLAAVGSAGVIVPIQIGGSSGLTQSYITSGCAGSGPCVAGSDGSFSEKNYDVKLFPGATPTPTPFTGYSQAGPVAPGATMGFSGNSNLFAMIAGDENSVAGVGNQSSNFWDGNGTSLMTIPVGLNNVNDVWMMLNNVWGVALANDTDVIFNFSATSNGAIVDQLVVDLTNTNQAGSGPSGQIRSAVDCASPCSFGGNTFASGPMSASSTPTSFLNGSPTTVTVTTKNVFFTSYTNAVGSAYGNTTGNLHLDAQDFDLSAFTSAGLYLESIQVQEQVGGSTPNSNTALSAITVDTVSPEPSTMVLLTAGFGILGFGYMRRKRLS